MTAYRVTAAVVLRVDADSRFEAEQFVVRYIDGHELRLGYMPVLVTLDADQDSPPDHHACRP